MVKKYVIFSFCLVVAFATIFFTACDSLWSVKEQSSLSFSVDLNQLFDDNENILFSVIDDDQKFSDLQAVVSLYNSDTKEQIRTQTVTVTEDNPSCIVQFLDLEPNTTVYAEIRFENSGEELFSARSNSLLLNAGPDNILKTFATTIYLDSSSGTDENNGFSREYPVQMLDKALELLGGENNLIEDGTITIIDDDLYPTKVLFDTSDYPSLTAELFCLYGGALGENLAINEEGWLVYENEDMFYVKATYTNQSSGNYTYEAMLYNTDDKVVSETSGSAQGQEIVATFTSFDGISEDTKFYAKLIISKDEKVVLEAISESTSIKAGEITELTAVNAGFYNPVINENGDFNSLTGKKIVTIDCATEDATIYYTLDGSDPDASSIRYDGEFEIDINEDHVTVKAIGIKESGLTSSITSKAFSKVGAVAAPTVLYNGDLLADGSEINFAMGLEFDCDTDGATISYKFNDGDYQDAIENLVKTIPEGATSITVKASKEGMADSAEQTITFTQEHAATPIILTDGYWNAENAIKTVEITCDTEGATIYYTDGEAEFSTTDWTPYKDLLTLDLNNGGTTIKAIAIKDGFSNSDIVSHEFAQVTNVETPEITFTTNENGETVAEITTTTDNATIYYTTDGKSPETSVLGTTLEYTGEFALKEQETVQAIAVKDLMRNSEVAIKKLILEVYASGDTETSGDGLSSANPVATFAEAKELLTSSVGTIWVVNSLAPTGEDETWKADDGNSITLKRYASNNYQLINSEYSLTLQNITLDGNKDNFVEKVDALIKCMGVITLDDGAILQNNNGDAIYSYDQSWDSYGFVTMLSGSKIINNTGWGMTGWAATYTISGGTISGNTGGGINLTDQNNLYLSGDPVVKNNTNLEEGYDNDIELNNATGAPNNIYIKEELTGNEGSIGLNPWGIEQGSVVVQKHSDSSYEPTTEDVKKFFLDSDSTVDFAIAEGNIFIPVTDVYVNGNGEVENDENGEVGNDDFSGLDQDNPVATFAKAKQILTDKGTGSGTIWVMGGITVAERTDWEADEDKEIIMKRHESYPGTLATIESGTLTLSNITLDGNNTKVLEADSLVCVTHNNSIEGTLELYDDAILQNNNARENGGAIKVLGGVLRIWGGTITNNSAGGSGGGVYFF